MVDLNSIIIVITLSSNIKKLQLKDNKLHYKIKPDNMIFKKDTFK